MIGMMHPELPKLYEERNTILKRTDDFRRNRPPEHHTVADAEEWLALCKELRDVQARITDRLRASGMPI